MNKTDILRFLNEMADAQHQLCDVDGHRPWLPELEQKRIRNRQQILQSNNF